FDANIGACNSYFFHPLLCIVRSWPVQTVDTEVPDVRVASLPANDFHGSYPRRRHISVSALLDGINRSALERRWSRPAILRSCRDRSGMGHQPASAQGLEHEYREECSYPVKRKRQH